MLSENANKILDIGLVPLVVLDDAADAVGMGKALVEGEIPVAEVTFRTDVCLQSIEQMRTQVEGLIVGAGTVHTVEKAKEAVSAGATFIVTPAFNPSVVEWCLTNNIDIIPGVASPSDIEVANQMGLEVCKFFPAEAYGGIMTLKALAGPFSHMKFLPTGGVGLDNMNDYMDFNNVVAVGGSFMTPKNLVANKDWTGISELCKKIVNHMFDLKLLTMDLDDVLKIQTRDIEKLLKYYQRKNSSIISEIHLKDKQGKLESFCIKDSAKKSVIQFYQK